MPLPRPFTPFPNYKLHPLSSLSYDQVKRSTVVRSGTVAPYMHPLRLSPTLQTYFRDPKSPMGGGEAEGSSLKILYLQREIKNWTQQRLPPSVFPLSAAMPRTQAEPPLFSSILLCFW